MNSCKMSKQTGARRGQTRRTIVHAAIAGGLAGLGLGGAAPLSRAQAAADATKWPKDAFSQKAEADAIKALYAKTPEASDKINLDAPEIAENGAVVPIAVSTTLPERHLDRHLSLGKSVSACRKLPEFHPVLRPRSPTG